MASWRSIERLHPWGHLVDKVWRGLERTVDDALGVCFASMQVAQTSDVNAMAAQLRELERRVLELESQLKN